MKKISGFYFITDSVITRKPVLETVREAVRGGARIIQYREKNKPFDEKLSEAKDIQEICRQSGVLFIVNDDLELAKACRADGCHVGQGDMPYSKARGILGEKVVIGVSATNVSEAIAADRDGADYIGLGPIFATGTKKDAAQPIGVKAITSAKKECNSPIIAIGGITLGNASSVVNAGADGLCAISATVCASDVAAAVAGFAALFKASE